MLHHFRNTCPRVRTLIQHLLQQILQIQITTRREYQLSAMDLLQYLPLVLASIGEPIETQLVEQHTQRPNICLLRAVGLQLQYLRRHIVHSPAELLAELALLFVEIDAQPKIDKFNDW